MICDVVAFTFKEPQQPRKRVHPRRFVEEEATNEPVTEFASPQDYYRETLFYPTIDKIVAEIEARFDENEQEMLGVGNARRFVGAETLQTRAFFKWNTRIFFRV